LIPCLIGSVVATDCRLTRVVISFLLSGFQT
jgi:hypothetical protein